MFGIAIWSYSAGNLNALMGAIDGANKICGGSTEYLGFETLYFTDLHPKITDEKLALKQSLKVAVCVKKCPGQDLEEPIECKTNVNVPNCNTPQIKSRRFNSYDYQGYCVPVDISDFTEAERNKWLKLSRNLKRSGLGLALHSFNEQQYMVYLCCALSLVYV